MDYKKIIRQFKRKKILVIGDLILDRYIWGKVSRISPEAPVPIVEVTHENFLLGGAANVAHNIIALGGQATLSGIIGNDRAGEVMQTILDERNIHRDGVLKGQRPTTVKARVIAHNQQIVRFDREEKERIAGKTLDDLMLYLRHAVSKHDAVIISDYKKGVISSELVRAVLKFAKPANIFVSVDPKVRHFHCYKHVSLITPNVMEASIASGIDIRDEQSLINAGKSLLKKVKCDAILITRGEQGMSLFESGGIVHIPTVAKNVFDVTGAGDTVISAFTLAYAAGAGMVDAAVIANHAAGIVVGEVGTAVASKEELLNSLKKARPSVIIQN
jgi:D-beta-D-heptose 7-phosphate kinase/D-beta-D-heptose 1-phosphate adenosyltransferase